MDAYQFVTIIHKLTETTRLQTRESTEIYGQLQYLSARITFSSPTDQDILANTLEQAERLAIFGFGSAKFQDQKA